MGQVADPMQPHWAQRWWVRITAVNKKQGSARSFSQLGRDCPFLSLFPHTGGDGSWKRRGRGMFLELEVRPDFSYLWTWAPVQDWEEGGEEVWIRCENEVVIWTEYMEDRQRGPVGSDREGRLRKGRYQAWGGREGAKNHFPDVPSLM